MREEPSPVLLESGAGSNAVLERYDAGRQQLVPPAGSELWTALERAQALGRRGAGRRVAIIDADCDLRFEPLRRRVVRRKSWVPTAGPATHGTAVGLLVGAIAPECEIEFHNVVRDDGSLDVHAICDAVDEAASSGVDLINLSLGRPTHVTDAQAQRFMLAVMQAHPLAEQRDFLEAEHDPACRLCAAAGRAIARGVVVIAAAGNNSNTIFCPARAPGVQAAAYMATSARVFTVQSGETAERINLEDVTHPQSPLWDHTVQETDAFPGTSFASPIVAGLVALFDSPNEFVAYHRAGRLDSRAFLTWSAAMDDKAGPEETETGISAAHQIFDLAFRQLPHAHCSHQRQLKSDLLWTDPADCPSCGVMARSLFVNSGLFHLERAVNARSRDSQQEELDKALDILWASHRLAPWYASAAANLAKTLQLQGDPQQALEIYDRALALRPGFEVYETTRALIKASLDEGDETPPETIALSKRERDRAMRLIQNAGGYFQSVFDADWSGRARPPIDRKAVQAMEEASLRGLPVADYMLARTQLGGKPLRPAEEAAGLRLLRRAAYAGFPPAQVHLGRLYASGQHGVRKDWRKGVEWFEKAAAQGEAEAFAALSTAYEKGLGVPQSYRRAFEWLEKAAEHHAGSMQRLGFCLATGFGGLPRDFVKAVACFNKAAASGDATAKYCLGLAYERGDGVSKNAAKARRWFKDAAAAGYTAAGAALKRLDGQQ